MSNKIHLSGYHQGDIDGNQRFFDETTTEILFKFLDNQIQVRFVKELNYIPEPDSIVYFCSSAGGNYFFSVKINDKECLILTSY